MLAFDWMGIVGGTFGLAVGSHKGSHPAVNDSAAFQFVNGRSCIYSLVESLRPATVWLPSYICGAAVDAVNAAKARFRFFGMNGELEVDGWEWLAELRPGDLVLLVDYFGFPFKREYTDRIHKCGALCLEDACQAFFLPARNSGADFSVYSPRKFAGVPDGGILLVNNRDLRIGWELRDGPPSEWWMDSVRVAVARRDFDRHGDDSGWFERFQAVETANPTGHFRMSDLSAAILLHGLDYGEICVRRRANYQVLGAALAGIALFQHLPDDVVPLGFPVRTSRREALRIRLFEQRIYPPVHWPLEGTVPRDFDASHRLSAEILTLPCDQRYGREDMERTIAAVREALQ